MNGMGFNGRGGMGGRGGRGGGFNQMNPMAMNSMMPAMGMANPAFNMGMMGGMLKLDS